jgi:FtsP/CotA-like multicopper oxidase with cupredoxin domain
VGQRYDVVFTADKNDSNFWLRVSPGAPICGRAQIYNRPNVVVGAIIRYEGAALSNPKSTGFRTAITCVDELFTPHRQNSIPSSKFKSQLKSIDVRLGRGAGNVVNWLINGTSMHVDLEKPTMGYVKTDNYSSLLRSKDIIELPNRNEWYYWVVTSSFSPPLAHPIHLHGHDFWVLGSGVGKFPNSIDNLKFDNVMRRDTATLPGATNGAWLVLAFQTDNPGAWLMHCHTAWHSVQNFHMQFLERPMDIKETVSSWKDFDQGCAQWSKYWSSGARFGVLEDSGL